MDDIKKSSDESWKETVKPDFNFFITTLSIQASIALGQLANPVTNKIEEDLLQAKFIIDTMGMLKDKTNGNLTEAESNLLETVLYELRMHYIAKDKGEVK